MSKVISYVRREAVLFISLAAALVSMLFVAPDARYAEYVDWDVLMLLFSLMAVVASLKELGVFAAVSRVLTRRAKSARLLGTLLVLACFFFSMLVTNDVALITFVPLTVALLGGSQATLIFVISLETVAANLGSMATPIGNPQNLYLYAHYSMPANQFLSAVLPLTLFSLALLSVSCLLIKNCPLEFAAAEETTTPRGARQRYIICALQFAVCLLAVFKVFPAYIGFIFVLASSLVFAGKSLINVDYPLLATFICFFIFVGNLGRIEAIKSFLTEIIGSRELETGILASQVISNVPAALMLSGFTDNAAALMRGVDIGGLGTPVASLASLISLKLYVKSSGTRPLSYLKTFTLLNVIFLALLYALAKIL